MSIPQPATTPHDLLLAAAALAPRTVAMVQPLQQHQQEAAQGQELLKWVKASVPCHARTPPLLPGMH